MKKAAIKTSLLVAIVLTLGTIAAAQKLPSAGTDNIEVIAKIKLEMNGGRSSTSTTEVVLTGMAAIRRDDPSKVPGPADSWVIPTELLSMQLTGSDPLLGQITLMEDPLRRSLGELNLLKKPNGQWAVDSFFDIEYRIDFIGQPGGRGGPVHATGQVVVDGTSNTILWAEHHQTIPMNTNDPLLDNSGNPIGISLVALDILPAPPSSVEIKRELLRIEEKLDRLLRSSGSVQ